MKLISIIWQVLRLLFGGMDYDVAVNQVAMQNNINRGEIYLELKKRGYYRKDYTQFNVSPIVHR